ncbi:hypothetical protein DPMN_038754 [Dreissena polymorpha]|uniref:Uncharacterized protein n=1 Tax=Dreissena polymorpha TaxID=45954 RepID=A0A9D4RQM0_DREPO|nr:hypothetical protein DPMN_038754 [Dreissena polymorpha]
MDPDSFPSERESQFTLASVLFGLSFLGLILLGIYFLYKMCTDQSKSQNANQSVTSDRMFMKPVYAHEIEPGIVVLQSENGDYFKILKEYDMKQGNQYGSLSHSAPETTSHNFNIEAFGANGFQAIEPYRSRDLSQASAPPRTSIMADENEELLFERNRAAGFRPVQFSYGGDSMPPPYGAH